MLLNILLLLPAHAADLGLVEPRPTVDSALRDTVAYCHDVQVSLITGDARYRTRDDAKTGSSITWPVHDDARTTIEKAAYARSQANIGTDDMVVVPTGPNRFVIGSKVRSVTAPLPTLPVDCSFHIQPGEYSIFRLSPVDAEACRPIQYTGEGNAINLRATWSGPTGVVRFENVLDAFANSLGLSYSVKCQPDGEGGKVCSWSLFDSRSAQDSGKMYVQQHLTRTGQFVSPCIHAAF
ncbi:MAG: hypothetical protein KC656_07145 [Myxococcales bacterium]|nr:hypothetical protein [Myxococcales bacterium]